MIDLDQWVAHMERAELQLPIMLEAVVLEATKAMTALAKSYIGDEQQSLTITSPVPMHVPAWDPLATRTLDDKFRMGISKDDGAPLYRTGQMRESIRGEAEGFTGGIGSDDPVALWQEAGTSTIPPRPFLARAVIDGLPILEVRLFDMSRSILMPKGG